jgi:SAM-dependent methyltransferase
VVRRGRRHSLPVIDEVEYEPGTRVGALDGPVMSDTAHLCRLWLFTRPWTMKAGVGTIGGEVVIGRWLRGSTLTDRRQDQTQAYEGEHRELFEVFLELADDSEAQTRALLELVPWTGVQSLLSIGGGEGLVEAELLRHAPDAGIWYMDPSPEQAAAFRAHLDAGGLSSRVRGIAQSTFQEFATPHRFDRIVSMFSWFFVGTNKPDLHKLIDLLAPGGMALIVLPGRESIEADLYEALSPDRHTTLVSQDLVMGLEGIGRTADLHSFTKWLGNDEMFVDDAPSQASLAFAAFVAMRPVSELTEEEIEMVTGLFHARREPRGVPLIWDVVVVEAD